MSLIIISSEENKPIKKKNDLSEIKENLSKDGKNKTRSMAYIEQYQKTRKNEPEELSNEISPDDEDVELPKLIRSFITPKDPKSDTYSGYTNFDLFFSFVSNAKNTVDIMTNVVDGKILAKLLISVIDKGIKIRIITRNRKEQAYLRKLTKVYHNIEIRAYPKIHAKLLIRDKERMIVGSSNITDASLSETPRFYDVNSITDDKNAVKLGISIFDSIWHGKDLTEKYDENNILLYSRNGDEFLPKSLLDFVRNENKEIIFIMASGLIDQSILGKIYDSNRDVKKTIITWKEWKLLDTIDDSKLNTLKYLVDLSKGKLDEFKVSPKKSSIHAKVYLFRGQGFALISSQNLTVGSWQSLFETGIIVRGKAIKMLLDDIKNMENAQFDSINTAETERPESTWQGSSQEGKRPLPWELAEADLSWKIQRNRFQKYHKMNSKKIDEKFDLKHLPLFSEKGRNVYVPIKKHPENVIHELIRESREEWLRSKKRTHGSKEDYEKSLRRWEDILTEAKEINPHSRQISKIEEVIAWYKKKLEE